MSTHQKVVRLAGVAAALAAVTAVGLVPADAGTRIYPSQGYDCPVDDSVDRTTRQCVRFIGRPEIDTFGTLTGVVVYVVEEQLRRKANEPRFYIEESATPVAGAVVDIGFHISGDLGTTQGAVCSIVTGADGRGTCEPMSVGDATGLYDTSRKVITATFDGMDGRTGTPDDVFTRIVDDDRLAGDSSLVARIEGMVYGGHSDEDDD